VLLVSFVVYISLDKAVGGAHPTGCQRDSCQPSLVVGVGQERRQWPTAAYRLQSPA
jgi:hypothetical protein